MNTFSKTEGSGVAFYGNTWRPWVGFGDHNFCDELTERLLVTCESHGIGRRMDFILLCAVTYFYDVENIFAGFIAISGKPRSNPFVRIFKVYSGTILYDLSI